MPVFWVSSTAGVRISGASGSEDTGMRGLDFSYECHQHLMCKTRRSILEEHTVEDAIPIIILYGMNEAG